MGITHLRHKPKAHGFYKAGLDKYHADIFERNTLNDMRLSFELLVKNITGVEKSLENQKSNLGQALENTSETITVWDKLLKVAVAAIGAVAGAFGGWDWILTVLLAILAADYISGVLVAVMQKSLKSETGGLSSKVGLTGLCKKGLILLVVLVSALLDRATGAETHMFRDAVCWFYIANEGISIMENLTLAGVPFPERLKRLFSDTIKKDSSTSTDDPGE